MTSSARVEDAVTLRDGRTLAYAERGPADGAPVLAFHGTPGSRLEQHSASETYERLGVRYIGLDRPGMGRSDPLPRRRVLDWPDDVVQLAEALELDELIVLGYSGGCPYAAACAYLIPERLAAVGVVSGSAPKPWPGDLDAMLGDPPYADVSWAERFERDPGAFVDGIFASDVAVPPSDRSTYQRTEVRQWLVTALTEAFRQGIDGPVYDNFLEYQPWGFDPAEIQAPMFLWHGDADINAPVEEARLLARLAPDCTLETYPGEGHLLIFEGEEAILQTMLDVPRRL
jgi:pimeloyl-ACP methyl ester carboxylesterase